MLLQNKRKVQGSKGESISTDIQNIFFTHVEGLENHAKEFGFDVIVTKEVDNVLSFEWHGKMVL